MNQGYVELPLSFDCAGSCLFGVACRPDIAARVGVVIVVGGPQYRVGSHRQFVLLARDLAMHGFASLRFDFRGMGDSAGDKADFEQAGADIRAAIDAMCSRVAGVDQAVLWGLCDGASASAFYAGSDLRVAGLVLFNPWVRTSAGAAKAQVHHYYGRRLFERAFWGKLAKGGVEFRRSLRDAYATLRRAREVPGEQASGAALSDLPARVGSSIQRFAGPTLIALSERDLVAAEFRNAASGDGPLGAAMRRHGVDCREIAGADHTFSSAKLRGSAAEVTIGWLRATFGGARADSAGERLVPRS